MLRLLRTRADLRRKAGNIYGAIVTQARRREFYAVLGIPDTPQGRYEMVVLHLFVVLERLRDTEAGALARAVVEAFVSDMDDSARELGSGDLSVPRRVRRAAAGLYQRMSRYRAALATGSDGELASALALEVFADAPDRCALALAGYVRAAALELASQDTAAITAGTLVFPSPPSAAEVGS